ncbi:MAG TPA: tetratricopeptide repeat protein [Polyangia bacterium]
MTARLAVLVALALAAVPAVAQPGRPVPVAPPPVAGPAYQHVPLTGPPPAQAHIWQAYDAMFDGNDELARRLAADALRIMPDMVVAHLTQSFLAKRPEDAKQHLDAATAAAKAQKLLPWEKVWLQIAQARHAGKAAQELKLQDARIKAQPMEPWFYLFRAVQYRALDLPPMTEKARLDLEKAVSLWPTFRAAWNLLGYVYVAQGRANEALNALTKYVQLSPRLPNPHDSLGEVLLRVKRLRDAEAEYRTALRLDGAFHASRIGLGYTLVNAGIMTRQPNASPQGYQEYELAFAKSHEPWIKASALQFIAMSYLLEGKISRANESLERYEAFSRSLNNPDMLAQALTFNSMVYGVLGFYRQASAKADEAALVASDPRTTPAVKQTVTVKRAVIKAMILLELGEPAAAEARLKEIAKLAPNAVWIQQLAGEMKGVAGVFKGDPKKAVALLANATEDQPAALYYLARAQHKAGDVNGARGTYTRLAESTVLRPDVALWRFAAQEALRQPAR